MHTIRQPLKDCQFKVGEWYYNPMMERCGDERALYTKVSAITNCKTFWHIHFDEIISRDGTHKKIHPPIPQSNERYDDQMVHVKFDQIKVHLTALKYGL